VWIVRWILVASVIILILGLALQNDDLVNLSFFTWQSGKVPVYMVIYISFAAGMIVFLLLSIFHSVQQSFVIRKQKRTIRKLEDELDRLKSSIAAEQMESPRTGDAEGESKPKGEIPQSE